MQVADLTLEPPPRRPGRTGAKLLLVVLAVTLALLAVEGAVRVRHFVKTGSFGAVYRFELDATTGLRLPAPGRNGNIEVNELGFRGPSIEIPKPPGRLRVGFLGGSTTFCAEASGNHATWPHLVVEALRGAIPERSFDYVNAAAAGFATDASLTNLQHRLAPLEPDLIIIYHATNDLAKDSRRLAQVEGVWTTMEEGWLESYWMTWSLLRKNLLLRGATDGVSKLHADFDQLATDFETRLDTLVTAALEVAPLVAVATFAHRVRDDQPAAEQAHAARSALLYMPFFTPTDLVAGIAAYNRVIRRVAERDRVILIGDEDHIPADDEHFNDSVHLRDAGCVKMAERVIAALMGAEAFRRLTLR